MPSFVHPTPKWSAKGRGKGRTGRSRSPRRSDPIPVEIQRFRKVKSENRAGTGWQRRLKSAALTLLEYISNLFVQLLAHPDLDRSSNSARAAVYRKRQIDRRAQEIRDNVFRPSRAVPLLTGLSSNLSFNREFQPSVATRDEEIESVVADTIAITEVSTEESSEPIEIQGVFVPQPEEPPQPEVPFPDLRGFGIDIRPLPQYQYKEKVIISIDWHQVCDCIRLQYKSLRPVGYTIVPQLERAIQKVRETFVNCLVILVSYCCSGGFRNGVLSIADLPNCPFDHVVVTAERVKTGGKAFFLGQFAQRSCALCHLDDSAEIAIEFQEASERHHNITFIGIKVPRHWRTQREVRVYWAKNVLEALDHLRSKYRAVRY